MKRGKQIVIFLLVLLFCGGYAFWRSGLHLSPEAAMAAEEQGLRYGPSDKILLTYEKENGSQVLVGRWEKGLSVVGVEPKWGIFWKSTDLINGNMHCLLMEEPVEAFLTEENYIVGLCELPEATEVTCKLYVYDEVEKASVFVKELTMEIGEDGFFYGETSLPVEASTEYGYTVEHVKAKGKSGETIFIKGADV